MATVESGIVQTTMLINFLFFMNIPASFVARHLSRVTRPSLREAGQRTTTGGAQTILQPTINNKQQLPFIAVTNYAYISRKVNRKALKCRFLRLKCRKRGLNGNDLRGSVGAAAPGLEPERLRGLR